MSDDDKIANPNAINDEDLDQVAGGFPKLTKFQDVMKTSFDLTVTADRSPDEIMKGGGLDPRTLIKK